MRGKERQDVKQPTPFAQQDSPLYLFYTNIVCAEDLCVADVTALLETCTNGVWYKRHSFTIKGPWLHLLLLTFHVQVLNLFAPVFVESGSRHVERHHIRRLFGPVSFDEQDVHQCSQDGADMRADNGDPEIVVVVAEM